MQAKIRQVSMMALALLSSLSVSTVLSQENATVPIPVNRHRIMIRNLTGAFYADFSVIRGARCEYRISPRQELNDIFGFTLKLPCGVC